jgi:hypothetical protein
LAGAGNDSVLGRGGADSLSGDDGADTIDGGAENDTIRGGAGDDLLRGGTGNDRLDAGEGQDSVAWAVGDGTDRLDGGEGMDTLWLQGWTGDATDPWTTGENNTFIYNAGGPGAVTITASNFESVVCFAAGTRILTARGEVPVEALRAGDLVASPGAAAPLQPVRWVGQMTIDLARHRNRERVAPIRIRAGALGPGVPVRDLVVSPEHALLLHGRLVPARLLLDGAGIVQEAWWRRVTYWHVELDRHGVLVAEGALAESYLDDGNRHLFDVRLGLLHPDPGPRGGRYAALACAPLVQGPQDPALAAIRAGLPRLAGAATRVAALRAPPPR